MIVCAQCKTPVEKSRRFMDTRNGDLCVVVLCHGESELHRIPQRYSHLRPKGIHRWEAFSGVRLEELYLALSPDLPLSADADTNAKRFWRLSCKNQLVRNLRNHNRQD